MGLFTRQKKEKAPTQSGFFSRLRSGLSRTRQQLSGMRSLFLRHTHVDEDFLDELESQLLMADVGVEVTQSLLQALQKDNVKKKPPEERLTFLKEHMHSILSPCHQALTLDRSQRPFVILVVGVNGAGKTTSIGKLAHHYQQQGLNIMLAAGDTFRAAAVEQLKVWGQANHVPVIAQGTGADSASVIYDAYQAAQARQCDVLIADTAGRLHTQHNLMEELKKVKRVIGKLNPNAPHEVLLVLDAGTGQNALQQATQFHHAVDVSGLVLTKLDGTAKGGIVFAIAQKLKLPIRFLGVGEGKNDLRPFDDTAFIDALFNYEDTTEAENME